MKLVHSYFSSPIIFAENQTNVLVIENPTLLTKMIKDLLPDSNEDESLFVLSEKNSIIGIHKNLDIVTDLFSMEINSRKVITKLYQELNEYATNEMYIAIGELKATIFKFMLELTAYNELGFSLVDDFDLQGLLKLCEVKIEETDKKIVERVLDYVLINSKYAKVKCFVFLNLKSFLSTEELKELYKTIWYNKINILLIESKISDDKISGEIIRVIDKDLCEIY